MSLFNPFSRVRFGHSLHPSFTWACIQCSSALRHRPPSNGRQEGGRFPTPPPQRAEYPFWQQYLLGVYSSELCTCQSAPICKTTEIHGLYFRNCLVLFFNLNWNLRIRQSWAVFFCSFWRVVLLHPTTKWFCLSFSNAMAESAMVRSTGALFICAQQGHSLEVPELHLQPITRAEDAPICIHGMPLRFRRCAVDLFHPSWAKWGSGIPEPKIFSSLPLCVGKLLFFL